MELRHLRYFIAVDVDVRGVVQRPLRTYVQDPSPEWLRCGHSKLARSSFASKFNVVDFCKCLEARLYRPGRGRRLRPEIALRRLCFFEIEIHASGD
jgi:hypothetical protein